MASIGNFLLPVAWKTSQLENSDGFISTAFYKVDYSTSIGTISDMLNNTIYEISISIITPFDNNSTISVGTDEDINALISSSSNDTSIVAEYCDDTISYKVNDIIKIFVSGNPTQGEAIIKLVYRRN